MKRLTQLLYAALFGLIPVLITLPATAAELVMVEEPGCIWCDLWNRELSAIYPKTPEGKYAPLRRMQLHEAHKAEKVFQRPIVFTPTFVLVDEGKELGRIEGYPGEDFFWGLLGIMLDKSTDFDAGQG